MNYAVHNSHNNGAALLSCTIINYKYCSASGSKIQCIILMGDTVHKGTRARYKTFQSTVQMGAGYSAQRKWEIHCTKIQDCSTNGSTGPKNTKLQCKKWEIHCTRIQNCSAKVGRYKDTRTAVQKGAQDTREPSVNQCISSPYLAHLLPTILHESAHYHHGDDDVGLDCVGVGVDVDVCQSLANIRVCPGNVF